MYVYVTVLGDVVKVLIVSCVFPLSYAFQAAAPQSLALLLPLQHTVIYKKMNPSICPSRSKSIDTVEHHKSQTGSFEFHGGRMNIRVFFPPIYFSELHRRRCQLSVRIVKRKYMNFLICIQQ